MEPPLEAQVMLKFTKVLLTKFQFTKVQLGALYPSDFEPHPVSRKNKKMLTVNMVYLYLLCLLIWLCNDLFVLSFL